MSSLGARQLVAALTLACLAAPAFAQTFPAKPITLIVPFAPGGGGDSIARVVAQKMGVRVVVENRPGAGGVAATQFVARTTPDGHTLLLLGNTQAISESLIKSLPYSILKDFIPISRLTVSQVTVLVGKNSSLRTLSDLIREAKARPGRITVGIGLIGTTQHLSAELFKSKTGLDLTIVPFKSVANIYAGLVSGEIDVAFELVSGSIGHIKSGALRALAIGSDKRYAGLPDVPTVAEAGVRDYEVWAWSMIAAPTGTPTPIVERLNSELVNALEQADVRRRIEELGSTPMGSTPQQAQEFLANEVHDKHIFPDRLV